MIKSLRISLLVLFGLIAAVTDPLQELKISSDDAQQYILSTVIDNNLSYPTTATAVPPVLRAEVAKGMCEFAKAYTQSAHFKTRYEEWWKGIEPQKPATLEERIKETDEQAANDKARSVQDIENIKKQLAETKDAALKKALEDALRQVEQIKKQMDTPEMKAMMEQAKAAQKQAFEMEVKTDNENYNKQYAEWLAKKNSDVVIKKLLQQYLALENTVDFSAATYKNAYGRIVFMDPTNEAKSSDWKMCFRAGKDVNAAAKAFVQRWLVELN